MKSYTLQFKQQVVDEVAAGKSISEAARNHTVSAHSIRKWIRHALEGTLKGSDCTPGQGSKLIHELRAKKGAN